MNARGGSGLGGHRGRSRRRVAVLSKKKLDTHRYDQWLGPQRCDVVLFAEDTAAARAFLDAVPHRFAAVRLFGDWKQNRAIDMAVLADHESQPFDGLVALSECDVVRAAELRERMGVRGQEVASAEAFRDKAAMKALAQAAALETPAYQCVNSIADLMDFAVGHRANVVVKPLDGAGSANTARLQGMDAVESWAVAQAFCCDEPARYLAEEWIDAPMLAVDGVMDAGDIRTFMVGAYVGTCLQTVSALEPSGVLMLDPADPRGPAAVDYTARLLKALPCADVPMSFHCELFDIPGRGLALCEIACRTGGGNTNRIARQVLALDLEKTACLGQAGLPVDVPLAGPRPGTIMGDMLVPHPGRPLVASLPPCPLPGVLSVTVNQEIAATTSRTSKMSQYVVDALFEADDHAGLQWIYAELEQWLRRVLVWH
jgi:hypothetical protein